MRSKTTESLPTKAAPNTGATEASAQSDHPASGQQLDGMRNKTAEAFPAKAAPNTGVTEASVQSDRDRETDDSWRRAGSWVFLPWNEPPSTVTYTANGDGSYAIEFDIPCQLELTCDYYLFCASELNGNSCIRDSHRQWIKQVRVPRTLPGQRIHVKESIPGTILFDKSVDTWFCFGNEGYGCRPNRPIHRAVAAEPRPSGR